MACCLTIEEEGNAAVKQALGAAKVPTVMLERELAPAIPAVGADHYNGTKQATEYLLSLGHRRIALISGGRTNRVGRDRLRGFREAHQNAGVQLDEQLFRLDSFFLPLLCFVKRNCFWHLSNRLQP